MGVSFRKRLKEDQSGKVKGSPSFILLTESDEVCGLVNRDSYICISIINIIFLTIVLLAGVGHIL